MFSTLRDALNEASKYPVWDKLVLLHQIAFIDIQTIIKEIIK